MIGLNSVLMAKPWQFFDKRLFVFKLKVKSCKRGQMDDANLPPLETFNLKLETFNLKLST
jgi:hypothetical protein